MLDMMKMDLANFTIQQMRPYIQQQSVEYERKKFEEFKEKQRRMLDYLLVLKFIVVYKMLYKVWPQKLHH